MFRSPLTDLLVVIAILVLFVGPKKLPQLGRGLGEGLRGFKDGIVGASAHDRDDDVPEPSLTQAAAPPPPGAADARSAQTPGATRREAGSGPRA